MTDTHSHVAAGSMADGLIAAEVKLQDAMWGITNGRADNAGGQMLKAALAQADLVALRSIDGFASENALTVAQNTFYPKDWSGFRDYGSDIANLVVAAAYIRQEIKRRIVAGEPTHRTRRGEDQPYRPTANPAFTTADPDYIEKAGLTMSEAGNHEVGLSAAQIAHGDRVAARHADNPNG